MKPKVLVADDERGICRILTHGLENEGFEVEVSNEGNATIQMLSRAGFDVLVLDINMPGCDGFRVLDYLKGQRVRPAVIMMTAYGSIESAVRAMQLGASDYITKPFDCTQLIRKINNLLSNKNESGERKKEEQRVNFIGSSPEVQRIKSTIDKVKDLMSNVLITGESGTGKGVVAKMLHYDSKRAKQPFVYVDCASIQQNLMESTLFGHEKGAFTGAIGLQKGKFELAGEGTIFLDEIGTLPKNLQAHLLVVLQERQFCRIGSSAPISMRARVVSATNEDLEERVKNGEFREDLYYRINIIRLQIPPLRERVEDISELAEYFLSVQSMRNGKQSFSFAPETVEMLHQYRWPGNIRELENAVEYAVAMADGTQIKPQDMPLYVLEGSHMVWRQSSIRAPELSLPEQEMMSIINALERYGGHRGKTAAALGISRRTLQYKLKKYGLANIGRPSKGIE